ncbi:MAG: hypothetical protein KKA05_06395, partial [Alphaproteobacteria bacterium]|nr:hypothetical protein [Alphaproteobacteria bacterium]
ILSASDEKTQPDILDHHDTLGELVTMKNWFAQSITKEPTNSEQLSEVAQLISKYAELSLWSDFAFKEPQKASFFKSIFTEVIKEGAYEYLDVGKTIIDYGKIKALVGTDLALSLLKKLTDWDMSDALNEGDLYSIPSDFIEDISKIEEKDEYALILDMIDNRLQSLTQEDWQQALSVENDDLRLLLARTKAENVTLLVEAYRPALLSHALKVFDGTCKPTNYADQWHFVLTGLGEGNRTKLAEDILNSLSTLTVTKEGCENFIKLYLDIAKRIPFATYPDISLDKVFSKVLNTKDENIKQFLQEAKMDIKKCLKSASEETRKSFEEVIESIEGISEGEADEWVLQLRSMCGLKPRPANDESAEISKLKEGEP